MDRCGHGGGTAEWTNTHRTYPEHTLGPALQLITIKAYFHRSNNEMPIYLRDVVALQHVRKPSGYFYN